MNLLADRRYDEYLLGWIAERTGGAPMRSTAASAIGLHDGNNVVAAAMFHDWSGPNVFVHLAIDDPRATRKLFRLIGQYAFGQLGVKRLTLIAESSNVQAVKLHEKLGAVHEGTLAGAGRNEDDILISRLTPDCKVWRKLDGKQIFSTSPARLRRVAPATGGDESAVVPADGASLEGQY